LRDNTHIITVIVQAVADGGGIRKTRKCDSL